MVEWKKLGDICEKTSNIKWKDQADDKIYKYIDLSSVSLDSHKVIVTTDVCKQNAPSRAQQIVCANDILLGTTRPTLKRYCQIPSYLDKNICSTGFCIFRANKEYVLSRWLFHNIGSSKFWDYCELKQQGAGYPCLSNSDAFAYMIPIPSIEEQNRIVGILDTFTASIDNLKEQIAQRRKQYEYYRDQLLDLEGKEGVEMKKLSCIAEIGTGSSNTQDELEKGKYPFFVRSQIVRWKNEYEFDETAIITSGDGVGVGKVLHYYEGKYALHQRAYRIHVLVDDFVPKFLFYFMQKDFYNYIMLNAYAASVTSVRKPMLLNYPIPVPSLQEQQRIVDILDTFEASIQNLEAQLSQREKQYDYYRNKLLTFE